MHEQGTEVNTEDSRIASNAAKMAKARINTIPYLATIHLRWRFCLIEYNGGRICFDGRNQTADAKSVREGAHRQTALTEHH